MPSLIAYLQLGHETDCVGKYALHQCPVLMPQTLLLHGMVSELRSAVATWEVGRTAQHCGPTAHVTVADSRPTEI